MALNPPTARGQIVDSAPPAIMASPSPRWIHLNASPMEWVPVAHAVTTLMFGPLAPKRMEICPANSLMIDMGMKKGVMRRYPFSMYAR